MYLRRKMQSQSSRRLDTPRLWMLYSSLLDMSKGMPDMTPEELAAFRAEDRSGEVYIIHTIFFVLAILSVFARLGAARHSGRKIGWDDWLAVASLIFIMGVFTGTMFWLKFGLGRHAIVVQEEDPMNITHFYQTIFANEILYPMGLATARLSLVILYHRIFGLFSARYYLYGLMAFIGAWAVYATIPTIVACIPVQNFWTTHKNCIDVSKLYISIAVGSIVTDFVLILVPIPNCFITIIRLVKVSTFDYSDPTWGTVDLMIWTGLEAYCSFKDTDRNPGDVSQPEVYLKMPPQIASRSSEEALEEYDFVKMSLADLQQYSRRLTMGESGSIPNAVAYRQ
ncbi:integral membrane protein [Colletotrichum tofieldiae]|nr:integral membrane protein [Colletotrichum tofieldiae]